MVVVVMGPEGYYSQLHTKMAESNHTASLLPDGAVVEPGGSDEAFGEQR